jgi:STE24 endopeptidase
MPFIFLLLFALICLGSPWPAPRAGLTEQGCLILVGTMMLASWLLAGLIAKALAWHLQRQTEPRSTLLRRYVRWRRYHFIGLLAIYLASLYVFGWGHVLTGFWMQWAPLVFAPGENDNLPGFQVGLLVPLFVGLMLAWERFYLVEKTAYENAHVDDRFITKGAYLLMQIRHHFFLVMPPVLLLLVQQVLFAIFRFGPDSDVPAIIALGMMGTAFLFMPILLRLFLGLKPLPAGPLRDRLESAAKRLKFGYSDILLWETRGTVANAMVTGLTPWIRYIILTDRLIEDLTPDEIEGVFGHEVGHIKHYHLIFYLAFFMTSFIMLGLIWEGIRAGITQETVRVVVTAIPDVGEQVWTEIGTDIWETLRGLKGFGKLFLLAGYTLLVFGYLSRRCERQADLYGAHAVSTEVFVNALEKVAYINGIPRNRGGNWLLSWQHPTIAQRIDFLHEMSAHPDRVPRFHRSISLAQLACVSLLALMLWWFQLPRVWTLLAEF